MAEVYGHSAKAVMPWIANVVRSIEMLERRNAEVDEIAVPGLDTDGLRIIPNASGWFMARTCRSPQVAPIRQAVCNTPSFRHASTAMTKISWDYGADEFRFHQFGMDRST